MGRHTDPAERKNRRLEQQQKEHKSVSMHHIPALRVHTVHVFVSWKQRISITV